MLHAPASPARAKADGAKQVAEELRLLRDPSALAAAGLLLLEDTSSSTSSSSSSCGRFVFSLEELTVGSSWQTPAGHLLCRVSEDKLNYFIGPAHQTLLGAEVYALRVRPLAKTIEYLPQASLIDVLAYLPAPDYIACRAVSRFWRKTVDEHIMSAELTLQLNQQRKRHLEDLLARLPSEIVLHIFSYLQARDLARMCQTSFGNWSYINHNEDRLWQALFKRRWTHTRDKLIDAHGCSWKLWYVLNDRLWRAKSLLGHQAKELLADYTNQVPQLHSSLGSAISNIVEKALPHSTHSQDASGSEPESSSKGLSRPDGHEKGTEDHEEHPDDAKGKEGGWHWPHLGKMNRVQSKHPESAHFLREKLKQIDSKHFAARPTGGHKISASVLVIGPKHIGKSSFVMKALADRFESNSQLDLDEFGASVNKVFSVQPINVNLRVFTLSRIPDYNDLFNVGAVVVAFDLTSVHQHEEALRWVKATKKEGRNNIFIAMVGLRKDLMEGEDNEAYRRKELAIRTGVGVYKELSARSVTGTKAAKCFAHIARFLVDYPELWVPPIHLQSHAMAQNLSRPPMYTD